MACWIVLFAWDWSACQVRETKGEQIIAMRVLVLRLRDMVWPFQTR